MNNKRRGELGEHIAASFLTIKGYEVFHRNYRFARREVDLLARDGRSLVAVEVKLRRGNQFGRAAEAIDDRKLTRVRQALEGMVGASGTPLNPRIDVIAIDIDDDFGRMVVEHFEGVY